MGGAEKATGEDGASGWAHLRNIAEVGVFLFAALAYNASFPFGPPLLTGALMAFAGMYFVIFVHELGHAAAALACRHRVVLFAVRPVAWNIVNRSVIVMAKGYEKGVGGLVAHVPRGPGLDTPLRQAVITLCGPLANVALAGAGMWLAVSHPSMRGQPGALLDAMGTGIFVQSIWTALVSLPPGGSDYSSDGQTLWGLLRRPDDWRRLRPLASLGGLMKYNERLRDRPRWLIDEVQALVPDVEGLKQMLRAMQVGIALDAVTVDPPAVRRLLDNYRADYGDGEWLASCDAYFTAIWERDPVGARALLWHGDPHESDHAMAAAAEAAVAAVAGDSITTEVKLVAMRVELAKRSPYTDPTFVDIHRNIMRLLNETPPNARVEAVRASATN